MSKYDHLMCNLLLGQCTLNLFLCEKFGRYNLTCSDSRPHEILSSKMTGIGALDCRSFLTFDYDIGVTV